MLCPFNRLQLTSVSFISLPRLASNIKQVCWNGIALTIALIGFAASIRAAEDKPFLSPDQGIDFDSKLFEPGKLDFLYRHRTEGNENQYNAFAWSPFFKGGGGTFVPENRTSTRYGGGFLRPLAAWPDKGDLILGGHVVEAGMRRDYEAQGEYRFPFGLGLGGGFVNTFQPANDVTLGKMTFHQNSKEWSYVLEGQFQEFGGRTSPGGYAAIFNKEWMAVAGTDGEQWRVTGGYIAGENKTLFRPAVEVVYVDNSIGHLDGPRVLFANLTFKYEGGFLSHPVRLGRAMGPQGLEFGNPLGFLTPTWNRRLEVWELGSVGGLRADRIRFPNGAVNERYEGLLFPFQIARSQTVLDRIFVGGAYVKTPVKSTPAILGGFFGQLSFLRVSIGVEHELDPAQTSVVVGLIDTF